MPQVSAADLVLPAPSEGSAEVRARVAAARRLQRSRFAAAGGAAARLHTNAEASGQLLEAIATPDAEGMRLMRHAAETLGLSARAFHRSLKVARTIADLEGATTVGRQHVAEALSYRSEVPKSERLAA